MVDEHEARRENANVSAAISLPRRLMAGGTGALTPVLLSLAVLDLRTTLAETDAFVALGYAARVLALFALGALTAWLHKEECDERKLFQLGIAGPALLTTLLTGAQVPAARPAGGPGPRVGVAAMLVRPLHAQPAAARRVAPRIYSFDDVPPRADASERFLDGFLGKAPSEGPFFVVLSDEVYADSVAAYRRVQRVRALDDDFRDAQVFRRPGHGGYVIVVGGWLRGKDVGELVGEVREERLVGRVVTRATAADLLRP